MIRYSFIVPIYNDAYLAADFCQEYSKVFQNYLGVQDIAPQVELIFVNDGSADRSEEILAKIPDRYPFVKVINLSRNFGQHIALSCGYRHAKGQYIGMLNVDMQDPPDQIPLLLQVLEKDDADFVLGTRRSRSDPWNEKATSYLFGVLLNWLTGYNLPLNAAALRVMNRRFADEYNSLSEGSRYLPGLEGWLGFRRSYVEITHQPRRIGRSSYNFQKRLRMAAEAVISFSDLPLRITVVFGFIVVVLGFVLTIGLIVQRLFFREIQLGYTSTVSAVVFFGGIQLVVIGIASLYIGRVLKEVQHRPLYVIRSKLNM